MVDSNKKRTPLRKVLHDKIMFLIFISVRGHRNPRCSNLSWLVFIFYNLFQRKHDLYMYEKKDNKGFVALHC